MLGQTIRGRYRIIQQIGEGGFGVTFLALDIQRPRNPQCVVKQFKPVATDPYTLQHAKRLFDQEAEILEVLGNHDQIPRLLAHRTYALVTKNKALRKRKRTLRANAQRLRRRYGRNDKNPLFLRKSWLIVKRIKNFT
ncbi:MAG: hypothetical protein KME30_15990 [Iphinoe sp. HA4291-MV1]|jgi:serine/threonine protein kinase|nr:hypothetical protein [Iphinoe sp. HA4291-MV1]